MKRKILSTLLALVLALSLGLVTAVPVSAAYGITTVTPTDITVGPAYTPLTGPAIVETAATDITAGTIILTAPTGFEFDTGASVTATVTGTGTPLQLAGGASFETVTPTISTITITVTAQSVTDPSTITYTGIRIKDSDDTSGTTNDLVFSGTSNVAGNAGTLTSIPDVIDHFALETSGAGTEVAGTAFTITVTAQDVFDNTATSYIGVAVSVAFTSTATAAPDATAPTIPTPQVLDFSAIPGIVTATGFILVDATETPDITATDGTYSGTAAAITVNPEVLAAYTVVPDALTQTAGTPFDVVITAVDQYENPLGTGYADPVGVYTWETNAGGTPVIGTLVFGDFGGVGVATESVTLDFIETGVTFTATDIDTITGTSAAIEVVAGPAAYLTVTGDATMTAGGTNELTITAYDSADNVATSYTGSKTLIFSGPGVAPDATAPTVEGVTMLNETTVTFTAGVSVALSATLIAYNAEAPEVDVDDGTVDSTGNAAYDLNLTVDPAAAAQLAYTGGPATVVAGAETTAFTVQRQDQFGNPVTSGATVVGLASNSTGAAKVFKAAPGGDAVTEVTIPDAGSTVVFYYDDEKAGAWTITASATGLTPAESALTVNPDVIDHYAVSPIASPQVIGATFPVIIQAQDIFNNDITSGGEASEAITITYVVTDGPATPDATTTVDGTVTVDVSLTVITLGQSITFTGVSTMDGTSNPFQVVAVGAIDHYEVTAIPVAQDTGEVFDVIIQAQDANNNDITLGPEENITITFGLDAGAGTPTGTTIAGTATVSITMTVAQAGQTIIVTGDVSDVSGTSNSFTVYDDFLTFVQDDWTLTSIDKWLNTTDSAWIDTPLQILKYTSTGFLSATLADGDLEPVEALYVQMDGAGKKLGIIYSTAVQGMSDKDLVAGWNLISSATSVPDNADDVLSPLQDVGSLGVGLTTLVSQDIYNQNTGDLYIDASTWGNLAAVDLNAFDGYWVYMNAAKSFGVIPD